MRSRASIVPELRGFFFFSEGLDLVVLVARMMEKLKVDIRVAKLRGRLSSSAEEAERDQGLRERRKNRRFLRTEPGSKGSNLISDEVT